MTAQSRGGDPLWAVALGVALLLTLIVGGIGGAVYFARAHVASSTLPEAVDAAFGTNPDAAPMIEAMQEGFPADYARIRSALSESARRGASPAAMEAQTYALIRNAAASHLGELAQAPHAELAAFVGAESQLIAALAEDDVPLCARYVMHGLGPGMILSPDAKIALAEKGVALWRGAAAGRDRPANRRVTLTPAPRDAEALVVALRKQGMTDRDLETFATPQQWLRAAPAQQCMTGRRLYAALGKMQAEQADRVLAWLILQKRLN